jgi:two-component system chemotaxis response regulator CheB
VTAGQGSEAVEPDARVVQRDVVVVGASAGGVQALQQLVAALPPELPASVLIALHLSSEATSVLHDILSRAGQLDASQAVDGERLERGHIYVAPPDRHLLVRGANVCLSAGPRENGHRPAIDPLFRSAARAFGARVIGVVLTGTLDDGTDGLRLIKDRGGCAVVQDPEDAAYGEMPASAIAYADPHWIVPLAEIGRVIVEVIDSPLDPDDDHTVTDPGEQPVEPLEALEAEFDPDGPDGEASLLTCPECGGVLIEREDREAVRFACQVGHAYSPESLVEQQGDALESALWQALRTLEERANLLYRMSKRAERRSMPETGSRMSQRADRTTRHATEIRNTILRLRDGESPEATPAGPPT